MIKMIKTKGKSTALRPSSLSQDLKSDIAMVPPGKKDIGHQHLRASAVPWPLDLHRSSFNVESPGSSGGQRFRETEKLLQGCPACRWGNRSQFRRVDFNTPTRPTVPDSLLLHTASWRQSHRDCGFLLVLVLETTPLQDFSPLGSDSSCTKSLGKASCYQDGNCGQEA